MKKGVKKKRKKRPHKFVKIVLKRFGLDLSSTLNLNTQYMHKFRKIYVIIPDFLLLRMPKSCQFFEFFFITFTSTACTGPIKSSPKEIFLPMPKHFLIACANKVCYLDYLSCNNKIWEFHKKLKNDKFKAAMNKTFPPK